MPAFSATTRPNHSPIRDIEAVLAGTLALMTAYAQTCCARQAALLAQKIVSNLGTLGGHGDLSANFHTVLRSLEGRWVHEVNEIGALAGAMACAPRSPQTDAELRPAPGRVH